MKLVTVRTDQGPRPARVDGDHFLILDAPDMASALGRPDWRENLPETGERIPVAGATLETVVPRPEKIVCVGLNYRSHAEETGLAVPEYPAIFAKYSCALLGPRDAVVLPRASVKVDWEAELVIVIGRRARNASRDAASEAIAGYAVANDISMRDWQARTPQWLQGKTFEASTPVGPAMVTLDELDSPDDLRITCEVDGVVVQDARTSDLIFSPAEIVSYLSTIFTLVPGDLILTGTPGGIGARKQPPQFLLPGQTVRTAIEGIGELVNVCMAEE